MFNNPSNSRDSRLKFLVGVFTLVCAGLLCFLVVLAIPGEGLDLQNPPTFQETLDNGLKVVAREDRRQPVVALQIWVKAGSVYEGRWLGAGLSHFVEHLAFKGPAGSPEGEIPRQIQNLGGEVNAYTSLDHTVFDVHVPSRNFRPALQLLRRLVLEVSFDPKEVEKEREVILKEINMNQDDPDRRLSKLFWATAFQVHPYRLPVIGYPELLKQIAVEDIVGYYRRWYVPNNLYLVVVGDVGAGEVFAAAREEFRADPMKPFPVSDVPAEPLQLAPRRAEEKMEVALARMEIGFHTVSLHHPDLYPLDVLAILLGQGRSSSLYQTVREEKRLVHAISASSYTPAYPGVFLVSAEVDDDKLPAAQAAILEVIGRYRGEGAVSEGALDKARRQVLSDYLNSLTTVQGQAHDLGSNLLLTGGWAFSRIYVEGVSAVTAEDIRRVARRYLTEDNMTVAVVRPERPSAASPTPPAPLAGGIEKHVLENSLTVLIRRDPSVPLVSIRASFRGGVLAENEKNNGVSNFLSRMLLKGTETRTAQKIAAEIEEKGGSIGSYSGHNSFGCSLAVLSDQIEPALSVLGDILKNCSFPAGEMEKERATILAQIEAERDQPESIASRLLRANLFEGHPYRFRPLGEEGSVRGLTQKDLVDFYRDFCCAQNGVVAIFGDVEPERALALVRTYLGEIPEGESARLAGRFPLPPEKVRQKVETKAGAEQAVLMLGFPAVDIRNPDRYPLQILSSFFTGLSSPLFLRVRDELGLAYYLGGYEILGLDPGAFVFYAGTIPGKTMTVLDEIRSEVGRVKEHGVSEEELQRNKNRLIGRHQFGLQTNDELSLTASLDELYGLGFDNYLKYEERISAAAAEDLKRVARKYFRDDDYTLVIVQPENGKR